jgi:hypothetical protein
VIHILVVHRLELIQEIDDGAANHVIGSVAGAVV